MINNEPTRIYRRLELEFVGDLRRDFLEPDGRPGDSLEPDPVQGEPGQLAHLDLPLAQRVRVGVAVDAEEQEPLALFVIAVVRIEHLKLREVVPCSHKTRMPHFATRKHKIHFLTAAP